MRTSCHSFACKKHKTKQNKTTRISYLQSLYVTFRAAPENASVCILMALRAAVSSLRSGWCYFALFLITEGRKTVKKRIDRGPQKVASPPRHDCWPRGVTSDHPAAAAAASILTSTPSRTSRVLGCLSHMTRVFVPVISTSISVCDTEYHFLFQHWWICLNRVWTTQGNSVKMANWNKLAATCYFTELV